MELLRGKFLINKRNWKVLADEILKGKSLVILVFSSLWCKDSLQFLSALIDLYEVAASRNIPLEIVYVSLDKSKEDMMKHFRNSHGNWLTLPYGDDIILILQYKYDVKTIPKAIVLSASGRVVTMDGYKEILRKGGKALSSWVSPYN